MRALLLAALMAIGFAPVAIAAEPDGDDATHKAIGAAMEVTLNPGARRLSGKAKLRMRPIDARSHTTGVAVLTLHPNLAVTKLTLDDRTSSFTRRGPELVIKLPKASKPGVGWIVGVEYAGRLASPQAMVGPLVAALPAQAGWLPIAAPGLMSGCAVALTVKAPKGWKATGPNARVATDGAKQAVKLDFPAGTLPALAAGPYRAFNTEGTTFWALGASPGDGAQAQALAALYKAHGLQLPGGRKGGATPTVVELPGGVQPFAGRDWAAGPRPPGGVAAWLATLAWTGGEAARPPRPERAWLVESLAAYSEDMLAEKPGGRPARDKASRAHLDAYLDFLRRTPAVDRPLTDPPDSGQPGYEAVVGDKGALVWGLLRDFVGEDAFWSLLRRHQVALRAGDSGPGFASAAGRRVAWLDGWLRQPGLPSARLEDVQVRADATGGTWQVTGTLAQQGAFFGLPLDLTLVTEAGTERLGFTAFAPRVPFHYVATSKPMRLVLDGTDRAPVRRRAHLSITEGVAPPDGLIVYGTQGEAPDNQAAKDTALALAERLKRFKGLILPVKADVELTPDERRKSLVLIGRPGVNALATEWSDQFPVRFIRGQAPGGDTFPTVDGKAIWWQGRAFTQPDQGVVQIVANPLKPEQVVLMFAGLSPRAQADALRFTQRASTFAVFGNPGVLEEGTSLRAFPDLDVVLY